MRGSAVYGQDCELSDNRSTQHEQEQPPLNGGLGDEFAEGGNQL